MESENHGWAKRRTWRKLPIGVDEASGEIVAAAVTAFDVSDGQLLPGLLDQIGENIAQVSGDRASDVRECYVGRAARKQKMVITATASLLHGNVPIKTIFGDRVRSRCFQGFISRRGYAGVRLVMKKRRNHQRFDVRNRRHAGLGILSVVRANAGGVNHLS